MKCRSHLIFALLSRTSDVTERGTSCILPHTIQAFEKAGLDYVSDLYGLLVTFAMNGRSERQFGKGKQ
jgi:hypothetical protein